MLIVIEVGVATSRPPREHATLVYTIEQPLVGFDFDTAERIAERTALEWAMQHKETVMPVRSRIVSILEI